MLWHTCARHIDDRLVSFVAMMQGALQRVWVAGTRGGGGLPNPSTISAPRRPARMEGYHSVHAPHDGALPAPAPPPCCLRRVALKHRAGTLTQPSPPAWLQGCAALDGTALGLELEVWQADDKGQYDDNYDTANYECRARVKVRQRRQSLP